jgi:twitching motility protein PilT
LHLIHGAPAVIRRDGRLMAISQEVITGEMIAAIIQSLLGDRYAIYLEKKDVDFSFGIGQVRLRGNAYFEKNNPALSLRIVPSEIPTFESLGMPDVVKNFTTHSQGFVLITGPTGHGKSTTLAAMVDYINSNRSEHIITLEDPIEYLFTQKKSIISQREVGGDTLSFADGLRSALREDPNVILVGEMRDLETIEAALTLAETGHLVLSTLHTNSSSQTADRIIDVFPAYKQSQIRTQFANALLGIVSQRLLPKINGGRVLASEVIVANNAVRTLIREGKVHQIPSVIQTSASEGMISLDKQLADLVKSGTVAAEEALAWSLDPKGLKMQLYQ